MKYERDISNKEILVLGAGDRINPNVINHDRIKHRSEIDVVWDLDNLPWPWEDNSFVFIEARAVLEHLSIGMIKAIDECWRLLKPNGHIFIKLPYWKSERCWDDPSHMRGYTLKSLDYTDPDTRFGREYPFYTSRKWKILTADFGSKGHHAVLFKLEVRKK